MGKNIPQHTFMRNRKLANRFLFSLQASTADGQGSDAVKGGVALVAEQKGGE